MILFSLIMHIRFYDFAKFYNGSDTGLQIRATLPQQCCISATTSLHPCRAHAAPLPHPSCIPAASLLHHCCTKAAPKLHQSCIQAISLLHPC